MCALPYYFYWRRALALCLNIVPNGQFYTKNLMCDILVIVLHCRKLLEGIASHDASRNKKFKLLLSIVPNSAIFPEYPND